MRHVGSLFNSLVVGFGLGYRLVGDHLFVGSGGFGLWFKASSGNRLIGSSSNWRGSGHGSCYWPTDIGSSHWGRICHCGGSNWGNVSGGSNWGNVGSHRGTHDSGGSDWGRNIGGSSHWGNVPSHRGSHDGCGGGLRRVNYSRGSLSPVLLLWGFFLGLKLFIFLRATLILRTLLLKIIILERSLGSITLLLN